MIKEIMLMIMMTGGGDNPVDASFIAVETMVECEERAAKAIAVFPAAGIPYVRHHCVTSHILFDDFLHNAEPTGPAYFFNMTFSEDRGQLIEAKPFPSLKKCKASGGNNCVIAFQDIKK